MPHFLHGVGSTDKQWLQVDVPTKLMSTIVYQGMLIILAGAVPCFLAMATLIITVLFARSSTSPLTLLPSRLAHTDVSGTSLSQHQLSIATS